MAHRRDIIMRRHGSHLEPVDPAEADALLKYPEEKDLWVQIRRKRSLAHHNLYWARLDQVIASGATGNRYHSAADLDKALKYEMGYLRAIKSVNGGDTFYDTDSIAFDRMDQTEFNSFFDKAMLLLGENFGINPDDLGA